MFPILLSLGAVQLNNSVDNFFALNLGAGNTTALTLSWRVANLPLGVFSVAIITVLYPLISRQAAEDDIKGIKESFSLGVREIGYVMIPAAAGLAILSYPIIKVLFEHYNFGPQDTAKVSFILIFHSLGLVFFGLLMILNRIFYAFKNVKTPLKVASVSIAGKPASGLDPYKVYGCGRTCPFYNACGSIQCHCPSYYPEEKSGKPWREKDSSFLFEDNALHGYHERYYLFCLEIYLRICLQGAGLAYTVEYLG